MGKYIIKRILYMIPMLFCVILVIYLIMSLTPGDPASNILPLTTPQSVKDAYNISVGYTGSLGARFLGYLKGLFSMNILSYTTQENIFGELAQRFPITFVLGLISFLLAAVIGISLGILSAVKQYSFIDTTLTVIAVFFGSVPAFLLASLGVLLFAVRLGVLPSFGLNDGLKSFVLPVAALTISAIPVLSRMTRSSMLSALNQDYIRTARAKGCSEKLVIWKHALKNASLPIITLLVTGFAGILGGSVIIEQIFSIPGIGMYMLQAINYKNVPVVMTCALILAFIFMVAMVLLDIFFALIDPKIRARYK
ncbi:MAG: ABC transporter permease [Eubacterium sp.]|nr:ABC transporter permease [Eubacterium sp.]